MSARKPSRKPIRPFQSQRFTRPVLEVLEDRLAPAVFNVSSAADLITAIDQADSNADARNLINLAMGVYTLSNQVIQPKVTKTLTILGVGSDSTFLQGDGSHRVMEILGRGANLTVEFSDLTIQGGRASDSGDLVGQGALGGGLFIDNANVVLSHVTIKDNWAVGARGMDGVLDTVNHKGGDGSPGQGAAGGAVYLTFGNLALDDCIVENNQVQGGDGGRGSPGEDGAKGPRTDGQGDDGFPDGEPGWSGGNGGTGGSANGGAIYLAKTQYPLISVLAITNSTISNNRATGGEGGQGGDGGDGGDGIDSTTYASSGGNGGTGGSGGPGGAANGGAIDVENNTFTFYSSKLSSNQARGGPGASGGAGGKAGNGPSSHQGSFHVANDATGQGGAGGRGGDGGPATGGAGAGGGRTLFDSSLPTFFSTSLDSNTAQGGDGGSGGDHAGRGGDREGAGAGGGIGGNGGGGGKGGGASGGGWYSIDYLVFVDSTENTNVQPTVNANTAQGGKGGKGGPAANGGTGGQNGNQYDFGYGGAGGFGGFGGQGGDVSGGGIFAYSVTLYGATLTRNQAQAGAGGDGGDGGNGIDGTPGTAYGGLGGTAGGGGEGGNGGDASGGGLSSTFLFGYQVTISTNQVTGGGGGNAGHFGKPGNGGGVNGNSLRGGDGGAVSDGGGGGRGGSASGGGGSVINLTFSLINSTLNTNSANGGNGGPGSSANGIEGGIGAPGLNDGGGGGSGGNGGDGGNGGGAFGGSIAAGSGFYAGSGTANLYGVVLSQSTAIGGIGGKGGDGINGSNGGNAESNTGEGGNGGNGGFGGDGGYGSSAYGAVYGSVVETNDTIIQGSGQAGNGGQGGKAGLAGNPGTGGPNGGDGNQGYDGRPGEDRAAGPMSDGASGGEYQFTPDPKNPVTQLVFSPVPPRVFTGIAFPYPVYVLAEDARGNVDPTFNGNVAVALVDSHGQPHKFLFGSLTSGSSDGVHVTARTNHGVAVFSDLTLSLGNTDGWRLLASTPDNSATGMSNYFVSIGYTPAQIRTAYGINQLPYDGEGQTIAIVVAFHDPNLFLDVDGFDRTFGVSDSGPTLYDEYKSAASFLTVVNQDGLSGPLPGTDPGDPDATPKRPPGGFEEEEALDVEWAHVIAPRAHIVVIECESIEPNLFTKGVTTADDFAAGKKPLPPGVAPVSVVSMSWGKPISALSQGEHDQYNPLFQTPGVTYVAATGDRKAPGFYPAASPNVVAVGGTTLAINLDSSYAAEQGWQFSGGGINFYDEDPDYQKQVQFLLRRAIPDVSFDADPGTGVALFDSFNNSLKNPWSSPGGFGTSLGTPCWAGLIALVNQGRNSKGKPNLNPSSLPTEVQEALYSLPPHDFHNNLGGNNGTTTDGLVDSRRYDEVTGLGSPRADLLVPDLIDYGSSITIKPNSLPAAVVGTPYHGVIWASGGIGRKTLKVTLLGGTNLNGLTFLSGSSELDIVGAPSSVGMIEFYVTATDTFGAISFKNYTLTILPRITNNQPTLPAGSVGVKYDQKLVGSGGSGSNTLSYHITSGVIPPGLIVATSGNGLTITGTPTTAGAVTFDVMNTDSTGNTATQTYTLIIGDLQRTLDPLKENTTAPKGKTISSLLGTSYSDPDPTTKRGIAVTQVSGSGTWQYSISGSTWLPVGNVSPLAGLLLPDSDLLRFVPAQNWYGQATLVFHAWDGSQDKAGGTASVTTVGGATPFSTAAGVVSVAVTKVNHAPVWSNPGAMLTPVVPGDNNPAGSSVADLFANSFTDIDGDPTGIAVTALTGNGTWECWRSGSNWMPLSVTPGAALLLSGNDQIRFRPQPGFLGLATLQAYAWDQNSGSDGDTVDLRGPGKTGGSTAFSTTTLTASCLVNTAPSLASSPVPTLSSINEDTTSSAVTLGSLLQGVTSDPDAEAVQGAAIVAANGPGKWQYALDGKTWQDLAGLTETSARLLAATASVRFLPGLHQWGQATLTYRGWDQTAGTSGGLFTISGTGGGYPFSATEVTASLTVQQVNHAPAWSGDSAALTTVPPGAGNPPGDTVASVFGPFFTDRDGSTPVGVAVTGLTGTASGTWQFFLGGGLMWQTMSNISRTTALLLSAGDRIRFLPNPALPGP